MNEKDCAHTDGVQVGRGVGGLASGVWGGLSGSNQKKKDAETAKAEAEENPEDEAETTPTAQKGGFF